MNNLDEFGIYVPGSIGVSVIINDLIPDNRILRNDYQLHMSRNNFYKLCFLPDEEGKFGRGIDAAINEARKFIYGSIDENIRRMEKTLHEKYFAIVDKEMEMRYRQNKIRVKLELNDKLSGAIKKIKSDLDNVQKAIIKKKKKELRNPFKLFRSWWNKRCSQKVQRDNFIYGVGYLKVWPFGFYKHIDVRKVRVAQPNQIPDYKNNLKDLVDAIQERIHK